ncbi:MAG: hypothetical protein ABII22_03775 [Candidatus Micrarchaeota archaeon]
MQFKRNTFENAGRGGGPGNGIPRTATPIVEPPAKAMLRIIENLKRTGNHEGLWTIVKDRNQVEEVIVTAVDAFLEGSGGYIPFSKIPEEHEIGPVTRARIIEKVSETLINRIRQAEASGDVDRLIAVFFKKQEYNYYTTTDDIEYTPAILEFADALARDGTFKAFEIIDQLMGYKFTARNAVVKVHPAFLERLISEETGKAKQKLQGIMQSDPDGDLNFYTLESVLERCVFHNDHKCGQICDLKEAIQFNQKTTDAEIKAMILLARLYGHEAIDLIKRSRLCNKLLSERRELNGSRNEYKIRQLLYEIDNTLRRQLSEKWDEGTQSDIALRRNEFRERLFTEMKRQGISISSLAYTLRVNHDDMNAVVNWNTVVNIGVVSGLIGTINSCAQCASHLNSSVGTGLWEMTAGFFWVGFATFIPLTALYIGKRLIQAGLAIKNGKEKEFFDEPGD